MLPDPLHPALVHFPIVLTVLLPVAAGLALWAVRRGAKPATVWLVPVGLAAALSLSTWAAVETGEQQEERVEVVVPERAIETHAELAERFLLLTVGVAALAAVGLLANRAGTVARGATVVAAALLVFAGYRVGHTGGALVYQHGAASAYVGSAANQQNPAENRAQEGNQGDDDDDDRR